MKIGPAERALNLSADKQIIGNFFSTMMAYFHGLKIQAMTDQCQETFRVPCTRAESCHNHVKLCFGYVMDYHYCIGGCYGG